MAAQASDVITGALSRFLFNAAFFGLDFIALTLRGLPRLVAAPLLRLTRFFAATAMFMCGARHITQLSQLILET